MPHRGPDHEGASVVDVTRVWLAIALRFVAETPLVTLSALTGGLVEFGCGQNGTVTIDNYLIPSLLNVEVIQVFCYAVGTEGWGCIKYPEKMSYGDVRFNVISVMRGWTGVKFPEKSVKYHLNGPI